MGLYIQAEPNGYYFMALERMMRQVKEVGSTDIHLTTVQHFPRLRNLLSLLYLSAENQLNFAAIERNKNIPYPLTLKINEQEDGTPIYYTFEDVDEFISFSQAMSLYVIETVQNGWKEKDSVDWTVFNIK